MGNAKHWQEAKIYKYYFFLKKKENGKGDTEIEELVSLSATLTDFKLLWQGFQPRSQAEVSLRL